jgi:hypothetical protein
MRLTPASRGYHWLVSWKVDGWAGHQRGAMRRQRARSDASRIIFAAVSDSPDRNASLSAGSLALLL